MICFVAYFGVSAVVTLMVPYQLLDENAAVANAFHQRGQAFMGHVIGVGATLGLAGKINTSRIEGLHMLKINNFQTTFHTF